MSIWVDLSHTLLDRSIISTRRPVLAAEYQEQAQMQCDLLWPGWCGCYVILHVKPFDFCPHSSPCYYMFGRVQAHIIDDLVSSALLCWDDLVSSEIIWWDDVVSSEIMRWDDLVYPPEFSVFSNPWEAAVELYGHLRSRTFGYGISLDLSKPWRWCQTVSILWGNLYTF